jgi:hypothetical protein
VIRNTEVHFDLESWSHIYARHVWWDLPLTSRYLPQNRNIPQLLKLAQMTFNKATEAVLEGNGNYCISANLGIDVGRDQSDFITSFNTVIIDLLRPPTTTMPGLARVVTMYPGF